VKSKHPTVTTGEMPVFRVSMPQKGMVTPVITVLLVTIHCHWA